MGSFGLNWIFMAVVIIFLGGIIIVFIYASSLRFRKKNVLPLFPRKFLLGGVGLSLVFSLKLNFSKRINFASYSVYSAHRASILTFIAVYLLLILLILIKITRSREGPLKTYFS